MRYSIAALILLGFLLLAVRSAQTKEPWEDESWLGTATFHLAETGSLATDVLEGAGTWRAGMRRHFYWEPPLSFLVIAAVVKVFGFSLVTVRSVSIAFGVLALLSTFALVWKLKGMRTSVCWRLAWCLLIIFFCWDLRMDEWTRWK